MPKRSYLPFFAGLTLILAGYLLVWLPNEAAGLSFIGLELGEWVKFLPEVRAGLISPGRNAFYLPPITLGLLLALLTAAWDNRRWQTWAARGLAVLVSLLAFPSLDVIRLEPPVEWLLRLLLIGLVAVVALLSATGRRIPPRLRWLAITLAALIGAVLPAWAFFAVRPAIARLWQSEPYPGLGLWLNTAGHLLILLLALQRAGLLSWGRRRRGGVVERGNA